MSPAREALSDERVKATSALIVTPEQHSVYFKNEAWLRAVCNEKAKLWKEQDEKLFAELYESMMKMADELGGKGGIIQ